MPITQARMISLINSASDFEQALTTACFTAKLYHDLAKQGKMDWKEAMISIYQMLNPSTLLAKATESPKILALERTHFLREAKNNDRAAAKAKDRRPTAAKPRRQKFGLDEQYIQYAPGRGTAPSSLERGIELLGSPFQVATTPEMLDTKPEGRTLNNSPHSAKPWVNPYDPIEEDFPPDLTLSKTLPKELQGLDLSKLGEGLSPETKRQIDLEVEAELRRQQAEAKLVELNITTKDSDED